MEEYIKDVGVSYTIKTKINFTMQETLSLNK